MNLNTLMLFSDNAGADAAAQGGGITQMLSLIIPMALLAIVFYFFIYRPQKKQEKETADMRTSIELGDVIVSSGGIVGMVVKIKDDMILIETSGDRTKIQLQKWAVHSVIEKANEPEEVKETKKESKKK